MHLAEDGSLTEAVAIGIMETAHALVHMVQLKGIDLAPWTGTHHLEATEFLSLS